MPFRRKEYPQDWEAIRARILERAGHRCERCGVKNYAVGYRERERWIERGVFDSYKEARTAATELNASRADLFVAHCRHIVIVLTIAHRDPNPMNCAEENLQALCQACHLALDSRLHAVRAQETREKKKRAQIQHKLWGNQQRTFIYAQDDFV